MESADNSEDLVDWYDQWHRLIVRILRQRLASAADVQDLSQEVYMRLLRVPHLDLIEYPQAYLYRVVASVCSEWALRARQSKPHLEDEVDELPAGTDIERDVQGRYSSERLHKALKELPPVCRAVIVLQWRDEMTYAQIAEHLGITPRMVKRHIVTGYEHLRKRMGDHRRPERRG